MRAMVTVTGYFFLHPKLFVCQRYFFFLWFIVSDVGIVRVRG